MTRSDREHFLGGQQRPRSSNLHHLGVPGKEQNKRASGPGGPQGFNVGSGRGLVRASDLTSKIQGPLPFPHVSQQSVFLLWSKLAPQETIRSCRSFQMHSSLQSCGKLGGRDPHISMMGTPKSQKRLGFVVWPYGSQYQCHSQTLASQPADPRQARPLDPT